MDVTAQAAGCDASMPAPPRVTGRRARVLVRELDVTDRHQLRIVVANAFDEVGEIGVIVSNAGYTLVGAAEEATGEQIDRQFGTNVLGPIHLVRAALPHLRAAFSL